MDLARRDDEICLTSDFAMAMALEMVGTKKSLPPAEIRMISERFVHLAIYPASDILPHHQKMLAHYLERIDHQYGPALTITSALKVMEVSNGPMNIQMGQWVLDHLDAMKGHSYRYALVAATAALTMADRGTAVQARAAQKILDYLADPKISDHATLAFNALDEIGDQLPANSPLVRAAAIVQQQLFDGSRLKTSPFANMSI